MVLNPVTLLHLIGGAHNDALMLGLLVAGLTAAKEKRPIVGILLCALATAIKAPAALGILYVGWSWLGPQASVARPDTTGGHRRPHRGRRPRILLLRERPWLGVGLHPRDARGGAFVDGADHVAGPGLHRYRPFRGQSASGLGGVLTVCRFLGLLAAGIAGVWLLLNSDRIGTLKALGITLLLFVILGPVVQPWYLSWGLILLAPVALGRLRSLIIGLSMVTAFIELPGGTRLVQSLIHGDPLQIVLTLLWILVVLTVPLATWERRPGGSQGPQGRCDFGAGCFLSRGSDPPPSEQPLEHHHVQPAVEFASDLPLHPDHGETAGLVEGDGGPVVPSDAGDHRVEAVPLASSTNSMSRARPTPRPRCSVST